MLVDLTFNKDKVNAEFKDRGVTFGTDTEKEGTNEYIAYYYITDPNHKFWKDHKHNPSGNKCVFGVRETTGIYWGWNLDSMIKDYFEDEVLDAYAMFNSSTGEIGTRDKIRDIFSRMGEEDISEEEHAVLLEQYCSFDRASYGVADTVQQVLMHYGPVLVNPNSRVILCFTEIHREDQSETGGWRWHKNGTYIGTKKPEHEHLYDDTHIDKVIQFNLIVLKDLS